MSLFVSIKELPAVQRILAAAQRDIEAETGERVRLTILPNSNGLINEDYVVDLTCALLGLKEENLLSPSRLQLLVDARKIAVLLMRDFLNTTLVKAAAILGGRDHSTIIHLYNSGMDLLKTQDTAFTIKYEMVKAAFINRLKELGNENKAKK